MYKLNRENKTILLVHWKVQNITEVFFTLTHFCQCYPRYNYNRLCSNLVNADGIFETEIVRVERKDIIQEVASSMGPKSNASDVLKVKEKKVYNDINDWEYWSSQPIKRRAEAVTFLVSEKLKKGQRMDKNIVNKIKTKQ